MEGILKSFTRTFLFGLFFATLISPINSAKAETRSPKDWTLLVFINGFNNLDSFGAKDINEMEKVGSTGKINVVVQWASLAAKDVKRLLVRKDTDTSNVTSPILENLGQIDMGSSKSLIEFVQWGAKKYPAKKYFVTVWNHGSGWHWTKKDSIVLNDISNDDLSGNSISTEELGAAMGTISTGLGQKVDLYGSDACLMGMVEVAAEMKNSVGVFVGSQETEPADGWPYDRLLTEWNKLSNESAQDVAKVLVSQYKLSYGSKSGITLSAFDLGKYSDLEVAVGKLSSAILAQPADAKSKVLKSGEDSDYFYDKDYRDLGDFSKQLAKNIPAFSPNVLAELNSAVSSFVFTNTVSSDHAAATGVSFWFPTKKSTYEKYESRYQALQFNKDTHWKDAAQFIHE